MDMNEFYEGRFFKAAVWGPNKRRKLTITQVNREEFQDDTSKPSLSFEGEDQGLVLNKSNTELLIAAFGSDSNDWIGKQIVVSTHKVRNAKGGLVDGFLVHPDLGEEMKDNIPF
jgi:hypothetical protein